MAISPRMLVYAQAVWCAQRFGTETQNNHLPTREEVNLQWTLDYPSFDPVIKSCLENSDKHEEISAALRLQFKYGTTINNKE